MNPTRRGFLSSLIAVPAAVSLAPVVAAPTTRSAGQLRVERADGRAFIVGIATETVHAGDFVQIETYGSVNVEIRDGAVVRRSDVSNGLGVRRTGLLK